MRSVLAWMCLVMVASVVALGLQLTTAAILPTAAALDEVTSAMSTRKLLLVAVDALTDNPAQVECEVPANSIASDVLLVEAKDFPTVSRACIRPDTG
jgi:hypothetical protein